jgi:hypothetical protein
VQITMAESFGVAGRGKFYEEAGAIRDVVQNHMLQVIACLAMECPAGKDHEARHDERGRLLKAVRTLDPSDVVRGQFRGYRREPGVAPDSQVETFAAIRFHIDDERWNGVPFYVRVGKCLPVTATKVLVRFKRPPRPVLDELDPPLANFYRFRLNPEMAIALGTKVKEPGERMVGNASSWSRTTSRPTRWNLTSGSWATPPMAMARSSRGRIPSRRPGASWTRPSGTRPRSSSTSPTPGDRPRWSWPWHPQEAGTIPSPRRCPDDATCPGRIPARCR